MFNTSDDWLKAFHVQHGVVAALLDDLLGHEGRDLGIVVETHGAVGAAGRQRPEDGHVAELLRERNEGLDHAGSVGGGVHGRDLSPAPVQVADDVTHVLLRSHDLDEHDRLEEDRLALRACMAESHAGSDLERQLVGIHGVERSVQQRDLERLHLVSGETAVGHRGLETLLDARDVLLGDIATLDLVYELQAGDTLVRGSDLHDDVGELAAAARLLLEHLAVLETGGDGFLVVDLGGTLVDVHTELAAQTVDDDVQMKLSHAADDGLPGLQVGLDGEGGILLRKFAEGDAELVEILLGLGLNGDADDGIRELDGLEREGARPFPSSWNARCTRTSLRQDVPNTPS